MKNHEIYYCKAQRENLNGVDSFERAFRFQP